MSLFVTSKKTRIVLSLLIISLVVSFYIFTPKYPKPNKNESTEVVVNFIEKVLDLESKNFEFQYMDKGGIPAELIQSVQKMAIEFKECNNKECFIKVYENHMDEWTSDKLRKSTRANFVIKKLGIVGVLINQYTYELY